MLIVISEEGKDDQILEYGIYDIYNPVMMSKLSLAGKKLAIPLSLYSSENGNLVAVKTYDSVEMKLYLTILRTGHSTVGSILAEMRVSSTFKLAMVSLGDSAILESSASSDASAGILESYRYYYNQLLLVRASTDDDSFKTTFSYGLEASNINDTKSFVTSLSLYNIRSLIVNSDVESQKIEFPKNANAAEIEIVLDADKYFKGPVASYSIQCPS